MRSIIISRTDKWEWTTLRQGSVWDSTLHLLDPRMGLGKLRIVTPVDKSEVVSMPMHVHSLLSELLIFECKLSGLAALWTLF
jgi:hypothetical protein